MQCKREKPTYIICIYFQNLNIIEPKSLLKESVVHVSRFLISSCRGTIIESTELTFCLITAVSLSI